MFVFLKKTISFDLAFFFQPNCNGRLYSGLYGLGGYDTVFKRKRRSAAIAKEAEQEEEGEGKDMARRRRGQEEEEEEEKTSGNVEFIIRIVDGGGTKNVNISSSGLSSCVVNLMIKLHFARAHFKGPTDSML